MAVLRPLKVVIENYPEGQVEELDAMNNPEDASAGTRKVPFPGSSTSSRRTSGRPAQEVPPPRAGPGGASAHATYQVRGRGEGRRGNVTEVHCTYDPETKGGDAPDGRKVKVTVHWVSAAHAVRPRCASTTGSSKENPDETAGTSSPTSTPSPSRS